MRMIILLLIHFICVAIIGIWEKNKGEFSIGRLLVTALVPLFGPLCMISLDVIRKNAGEDGAELHLNEPVIEDDIYRSIHIRPEKDSAGILPLEESLLINDPAKRRNLLLNILNLNPSDYVTGLRKAGVNDDTEVVHYAVTALVELRKDYNERLFQMEKEMEENPGVETLEKYRLLDEEYLRTGLPEKGEKEERIRHYNWILDQLLSRKSLTADKASLLGKRAGCFMALGEYDKAGHCLDRLIIMEPENEDHYLMKLRCLTAMKDRKAIDDLLTMIRTNHVFLSDESRKTVSFWDSQGILAG